ncbi:helix-turn-helix domain-containing protein [Motilibacter sp. E257]|uniref:Helix-turn-helix domain-containing protein n=2 Tax=Motilibacter deserti TaxID=2714956 RepID=A0ABX0GS93_9ACTN|nr:helix-turn-helix domain-containing protein [Motilibacter deserti]
MSERLLTVEDLASYIAKPKSWVYNNVGDLPALRLGKQLRFRHQDVEEWLNRQATT